MNMKITEHGVLAIERKGEFKKQMCPFRSNAENEVYCSDWCPHFEEPFPLDEVDEGETTWQLNLCHRKELIGPLVDERKEAKT